MTAETRVPATPQLVDTGLVAILRARAGDRLTEALAGAGVTCLEITLNTPSGLQAVRELRRTLPAGVAVGVGTATTPEQVSAARDAAAEFVVSPHVEPTLVRRCGELGLPCDPGALTPTEAGSAWRAGASAVKLFPAAVAGPTYVRQLRGPFPEIPLVPTGGVRIDEIAAYLSAGALAVGLGGPLLGDALAGGDLSALAEHARCALGAVAAARKELT